MRHVSGHFGIFKEFWSFRVVYSFICGCRDFSDSRLFLQVSLSIVHPKDALWLATYGFIGCLLGTPLGYAIGKLLGKSVLYKILKKQWIDAATNLFQKNGEAAILIGSFTPIPFKVFTILSGCLNFPLWRLMAYAALGRATKFYVVGTLFYLYGNAAEGMVKDVSLYIALIAVPLILIGIYFKRRRKRRKMQQQAEAVPSADPVEKPVLEQVTDQSPSA